MSWFGKILTFLVLIGACVWAYFTANVYATRTNWKARADAYEKAFKESEDARQKEARDNQSGREALTRLYAAEKSRADDLSVGFEKLRAASSKTDEDYKILLAKYTDVDVKADIFNANIKAAQEEVDTTRKRNNSLEDERVKLVLAKEAADRERLRAENEAKLSRAIADENAKRVETLTALVTELRQTGGGGGTATVLRNIQREPAPLPDNIRGTVVRDMVDDLVHINIGIDAGLEEGSRLDIYRESGGGRYLGTLVVTKSLYPKEAVARFQPASGKAITQLRPDELPRKGDTVGHVSTGGRGPR
jgi:hypothetical protein